MHVAEAVAETDPSWDSPDTEAVSVQLLAARLKSVFVMVDAGAPAAMVAFSVLSCTCLRSDMKGAIAGNLLYGMTPELLQKRSIEYFLLITRAVRLRGGHITITRHNQLEFGGGRPLE